MKVVLICGKARQGKDTLADFLIEAYEAQGKKVCRLAYGAYIKYYASKYFGWDGSEETKPRSLLNKIGTEIIREKIDPYFHVNRIMQDIEVLSYFFDVAIISDIREPIEITTPKEKFDDVISIKITRPDFSSELTTEQKKHYTETALDNFDNYDFKVLNDGTLEDLKKKAYTFTETGEF